MNQEVAARTNDDLTAAAAYMGISADDPRFTAAVIMCQRLGLDPFMGHVVIIKDARKPYITRDGLLAIAHAAGTLDGIELTDGPTLAEDSYWYARVTVWRKDMSHGFAFPGRYPNRGQYAPAMAIKCAESHALRRAFNVTGVTVADELEDNPPA